jgi:hypothetical protein
MRDVWSASPRLPAWASLRARVRVPFQVLPPRRALDGTKTSRTSRNHPHIPQPPAHPATTRTSRNHPHIPQPPAHPATTRTSRNHPHIPQPPAHPATTRTSRNHPHIPQPPAHPATTRTQARLLESAALAAPVRRSVTPTGAGPGIPSAPRRAPRARGRWSRHRHAGASVVSDPVTCSSQPLGRAHGVDGGCDRSPRDVGTLPAPGARPSWSGRACARGRPPERPRGTP